MFRERLIGPRGPVMRVELDKKALFALASDTRLDILKSLQPMRRTVTQLADSIGIDKAAVHRHLKTLEEGGFVKRYEDHGFVYYGLSWKARDLLSPNDNTRVVIMVSLTLVLAAVTVFLLMIASSVLDPESLGSPDRTAGEYTEEPVDAASVPQTLAVVGTVAAALASGILAYFAFRRIRRPRQPVKGEAH